MSDHSQGPGWWLASDGKWYPPDVQSEPTRIQPAAGDPGPGEPASRYGAAPGGAPYRPDEPTGVAPPWLPPGPPGPPGAPFLDDEEVRRRRTQRILYAVAGVVAAAIVAVVIALIVSNSHHKGTASSSTTAVPSTTTAQPTTSSSAATTTSSSSSTTTTRPSTTTSASTTIPTPPTTVAPINLSGSGQTATQPFPLGSGLSVFHATCSCSGNFSVQLLDSRGQTKDMLVNVVGGYDGTVGLGVDAGAYSINVGADAKWTVTITQPRGVAGMALPRAYSGKSQQLVGPFAATGAVRLQAHNVAGTQRGNFVVQVLNAAGDSEDVPFNQIGNFDGSTVSNNLSGGPYYLNVTSDGTWAITASAP